MSRAKRLKFPLVKGKQRYAPTDFKCPWCRKRRVGEPHSMAIFAGGGMAKGICESYLSMTWHGGHYIEATPPVETYEVLNIADDVSEQFDLMFCTTDCLRAYLNYCVDELERRVKKAKPGVVTASIREFKQIKKKAKRNGK